MTFTQDQKGTFNKSFDSIRSMATKFRKQGRCGALCSPLNILMSGNKSCVLLSDLVFTFSQIENVTANEMMTKIEDGYKLN